MEMMTLNGVSGVQAPVTVVPVNGEVVSQGFSMRDGAMIGIGIAGTLIGSYLAPKVYEWVKGLTADKEAAAPASAPEAK